MNYFNILTFFVQMGPALYLEDVVNFAIITGKCSLLIFQMKTYKLISLYCPLSYPYHYKLNVHVLYY